MIAQQITHKMLKYKDNELAMDMLGIMKQIAEFQEVLDVKASAALERTQHNYNPDARGK